MVQDSIITILNSEFHRSIDDTIINRLSESLFCENSFHNECWKTINFNGYNFIDLSDNNKIEELAHPNLIKVFVALYHKNESYRSVIEKTITNCLDNTSSEYYYIGLWCVSKLLGSIKFELSTLNKILDLYFRNTNVIFESLYQHILVAIYCDHCTDEIDVQVRRRLVDHIFANLSSKVHILTSILQRNISTNRIDALIESRLHQSPLSAYRCNPELFYCYSLCRNGNQQFTHTLIALLESLDERQLHAVCARFLHVANGVVIKDDGSLGAVLWRACVTLAGQPESRLAGPLLVAARVDTGILPLELFQRFIGERRFDVFRRCRLRFGMDQIHAALSHFGGGEVSDEGEAALMRCLCDSVCCHGDLVRGLLGDDGGVAGPMFWGLFTRCESTIVAGGDEGNNVQLYVDLVADCLANESLQPDDKLDLLRDRVGVLLGLQHALLQRYLSSDCLDILSTKPIALARQIVHISGQQKRLFGAGSSLQAVIDMTNSILSAADFYDDLLSESLLHCLLAFCLCDGDRDTALVDCTTALITMLANSNVSLNIKELLPLLPLYFDGRVNNGDREHWRAIAALLVDAMSRFPFRRCDVSLEVVQRTFQLLSFDGRAIDLFDQLTFVRDYCDTCQENIEELVDDIVLSCKPLDCFGD